MKQFYLASVLIGFLCACGTGSDKEAPVVDSLAQPPAPAPTLLGRFGKRLQMLVATDSGLVRGFTPGEPLAAVMQRETALLHEDSLTYKGYLLGDSLSTEVVDVRYFFNPKSRLTDSLVVDTYSEADSLMRELNAYFATRLGQAAVQKPKLLVWKTATHELLVRDIGVPKAPGLQIVARQARPRPSPRGGR